MSIAIYKFVKTIKWEHRGSTIELFLIDIHQPNYPNWDKAKAVWKVVINGKENSGCKTGDREEVLARQKAFIDWLIDDPDMTQLF